jgi:hypothetical protein
VGQPASVVLRVVGIALLCGCAAATQSASTASPKEPDCSFRSATTCWTFGSRFPAPRANSTDSVKKELQEQPATILAAGADSVPASR